MTKRVIGLFGGFALLCSLMIVRLAFLTTSPTLAETSQNQSSYRVNISQNRAEIYDRNYQSMVNTTSAYRAVVLPEPSSIENVLKLGSGRSREEIMELMESGKPFVLDSQYASSADPNITIYPVRERYGAASLAPHIIGYLDEAGNGLTGIEQAYDDFLNEHGTKTDAVYTLNGMGHYVKGGDSRIDSTGSSSAGVVLTLDSGIQDIIERVGAKTIPKGAIVVLDAKTAEIVGSASFPDFDPNHIAASVADTERSPMINRALYAFNVGSTFKIATAAAALESGISVSDTHYCNGSIEVAGQTFRCHYHAGHGLLNMQQAMRESCNPYYIDLALKTGGSRIRQIASDMGFGKEFLLADGIVSAKGNLPDETEFYNPGQVANFAFGQGSLMGTPLQVAELFFSVVNKGQVIAPSLVKGVTEDGTSLSEENSLPASISAMSEQTAKTLQEILTLAVSEQENESLKPEYTTAGGKSATAQTGQFDKDGNELYQTWFGGFFPAEEPEYVVVVLVEGGNSGTATAAPIFSEICDLITLYEQSAEKEP